MKKPFSIALARLFILTAPMTTFGGGNDQCFLKIDGIQVNRPSRHTGEIDLVGFRSGLLQKVVNSGGGGGGAGKWISVR
jgi:hypothetical protein